MRLLPIIVLLVLGVVVTPAQAEIDVDCKGQGSVVYLIGGGPAFTTWHLQPIQSMLATQHKVCRWDMRGVGDNASLPIKTDSTALSQWLQDMQDVLPSDPVILWGHSWGALQVLLFAKRHPKRISQIILSNPVDPALRSLDHIEQKRFAHPHIGDRASIDDMGTPVEELHVFRSKIASYFADAEKGWNYARRFTQRDGNGALNVRIWEEYRTSPLTDTDVQRLAHKISGLIHCRDDVLQPEALYEYQRLLPSSRHHVLTGCAHFPWEEHPLAYYQALFSSLSIDANQ